MDEKLIMTPEQLFFLGTAMGAKEINYDYIASMGEVQRNYIRARRKYMDDLARAGILRERLGGEIMMRPMAKKLLYPVFFGKKESCLEVFQLGKEKRHDSFRFHWWEDSVTQVQKNGDQLILSQIDPAGLETFVAQQIRTAERPMRVSQIFEDSITRIVMVKRTVVGECSSCMILFEQLGSLYQMDDSGKTHAIPAPQARAMILAELKGE